MKVIGYEKALDLMKNIGRNDRVTMQGETLLRVELYHPEQDIVYTVRAEIVPENSSPNASYVDVSMMRQQFAAKCVQDACIPVKWVCGHFLSLF